MVSSVIRCKNVEKKRQKRTNTRENRLWRASVIHWMRPGKLARSIVVPGSSSSRSFSSLKVSQKCSQLIHRRSCFCLASGLETRNRFQNRQEKNEKKEFYFSSRTKIFLDWKRETGVSEENKKFRRRVVRDRSDQSIHIAMGATPDLTESTRARNFLTFGVPLGCRPNASEAHQK